MTREEVKKLMVIIVNTYPNFKPSNLSVTVDIWLEILRGYPYEAMMTALKTYIVTDKSGFAPSIGQIIDKMNVVDDYTELNEMEAWALVSRALRDSSYHAQERFDELPPNVRKAVGSPENLMAWGRDENYNENVAQSQFIKCYRNVLQQKKELSRMPMEVRALIESTMNKMITG